jgi:cobalamin biosynthesis protein CbiG
LPDAARTTVPAASRSRYAVSTTDWTSIGTRLEALPPAKAEALKTVLEKRKLMVKALEAIAAKTLEMAEMQNEKSPVFVRVDHTVHPETAIAIQGKMVKFTQPVSRSVFYFDPLKDQILKKAA